jgi:hypothetical protein
MQEKMREGSATVTAADLAVKEAVRLAVSFSGVPARMDPGLPEELAGRKVSLDLQNASMKGILDLICARAGLDYGWIRGRLVVSSPDRLWPYPPEKRRRLAEGEIAALKEQIARLKDDSIEVRTDAMQTIEAAGEPALPYLEEAADRGDLEAKSRLRGVIAAIRTRTRPACFARTPAIERQKLDSAGQAVVATLRERKTEPLDAANIQLSAALELLVSPTGLKVEFAPPARAPKVDCLFDEEPIADAIFFLTAPHGLDVYVRDGRLIVDTAENVDKAISSK